MPGTSAKFSSQPKWIRDLFSRKGAPKNKTSKARNAAPGPRNPARAAMRRSQSIQARTLAKWRYYMNLSGYSRRRLSKRLRRRLKYLVLVILLTLTLGLPLISWLVSVSLHWNPVAGESKARSGYNNAMEVHQYLAHSRSSFLQSMSYQYGWIASLQRSLGLRILEFGADICLFVYSFYLRNFRSLCGGAMGKTVLRCRMVEWWDLLGGPFRFAYWYFPGSWSGSCWLYRTCPGMNWSWWNAIMRWVYLWSFDGLWDIRTVPWGWFSTFLFWVVGLGAGYRYGGYFAKFYLGILALVTSCISKLLHL